ncbi:MULTISPECIES: radical SAM protein [unclassified Caballeronia]|uniref:radical SAM protein n=1 Tax=unclassified Caballeronia TaxID=2646786 RepID=UPI002867A4C8|nr:MULTISPECIES: radical SAM protein [unclassified Caballeronia]MDR5752558.1 radical SAM protein [Caballeronia sp. LZ024]MDR5841714.1 radical SAM protein [Caballeronia sp. LZ031]
MPLSGTLALRPVEQLVLQGTSFCNINCTYCDLSEESRRTKSRMPPELALTLISELIDADLLAPDFVVVWHSGEPLTLLPAYYAGMIDAITDLCARRAPHVSVSFDIQTNGTLIDEAWCDFFERHARVIRLGVSCDGPPELHDAFRIDRRGKSTFERTLRGMNALDARGIRYNVIAVVTRKTMADPQSFLEFFHARRASLTDFHFNVLASPVAGMDDLTYAETDRAAFQRFYRRVFDWWDEKRHEGSALPIRNVSQTLERIATVGRADAPSFISETSAPLRSLNMDAKGNVTTFYAGLDIATQADRYGDGNGLALGNIQRTALAQMLVSKKLTAMLGDFARSHHRCAQTCEYYAVCPGGFELIQWLDHAGSHCDAPETTECIIHVKALTDAALDFIESTDRSQTEYR